MAALAAAPTDDDDPAGVGLGVAAVVVAATVGAAVAPGGSGGGEETGGGEYPSTGMKVPYSALPRLPASTLASLAASMGRNTSPRACRSGGVSRPPSTPATPRGAVGGAAVATPIRLKLWNVTWPYWERKELSEVKADCGLVRREASREWVRLVYGGMATGIAIAVPRTMLPACCEVTVTLDKLTPAVFARHCLYLHSKVADLSSIKASVTWLPVKMLAHVKQNSGAHGQTCQLETPAHQQLDHFWPSRQNTIVALTTQSWCDDDVAAR